MNGEMKIMESNIIILKLIRERNCANSGRRGKQVTEIMMQFDCLAMEEIKSNVRR